MKPHDRRRPPRALAHLALPLLLAVPACATAPPPAPIAAAATDPEHHYTVQLPERIEFTPPEGPEARLPEVQEPGGPEEPALEVLADCHARRGRGTEVIASHLSRRRAELNLCYEQALRKNPDLRGRLDLLFMLGPNGRVVAAEVQDSTVKDPAVAECLMSRALKWRFPRARESLVCTFRYPLFFTASR